MAEPDLRTERQPPGTPVVLPTRPRAGSGVSYIQHPGSSSAATPKPPRDGVTVAPFLAAVMHNYFPDRLAGETGGVEV